MEIDVFDKQYRDRLLGLHESLTRSYRRLVKAGDLSLENASLSEAILLRMSAFYRSQAATKEFLGKKVATAAADFFVEAILFYLKALIEIHHLPLRAASEQRIERNRQALRPDVSIWNGSELVYAIECKTQLGWNRSRWDSDFRERQVRLKSLFPNSQAFLVVLTAQNWSHGDDDLRDDLRLGTQLFVLSKLWPTDIAPENVNTAVLTPIEPLFRMIMQMNKFAG